MQLIGVVFANPTVGDTVGFVTIDAILLILIITASRRIIWRKAFNVGEHGWQCSNEPQGWNTVNLWEQCREG